MITNKFKLIKKTKLTHDIYELIFVSEQKLSSLPGQFITFILNSWLRRAYSVIDSNWFNFSFIIKRVEEGKWWSKEICDLHEWAEISWIGPIWNFVVKNDNKSKLFLGTWTWFAPLYSQIKHLLCNDFESKIHFCFWLRTRSDIFYEVQLEELKVTFSNFTFDIFLSREDRFKYRKWYIADYLNKSTISWFDDFYICWSPKVVTDIKLKLDSLSVNSENIFFEQY